MVTESSEKSRHDAAVRRGRLGRSGDGHQGRARAWSCSARPSRPTATSRCRSGSSTASRRSRASRSPVITRRRTCRRPACCARSRSRRTAISKVGDQILRLPCSRTANAVDVIGTSRGKGFQGVVKRHHFAGGAATHGSMFHRAPGSIGASSFPSRVVKGMRAAGRMGGDRSSLGAQTPEGRQGDPENNSADPARRYSGARTGYVVYSQGGLTREIQSKVCLMVVNRRARSRAGLRARGLEVKVIRVRRLAISRFAVRVAQRDADAPLADSNSSQILQLRAFSSSRRLEIVYTAKRTGARLAGPIPLPTSINNFTVLHHHTSTRSRASSSRSALTSL